MAINDTLAGWGEAVAPYITKEYLLNIWDIAKVVLIIIAIFLVIRFIVHLKFLQRIKLILKNVKEINEKMSKLVGLMDDNVIVVDKENNKKKVTPLIKKFLKTKQ